MGWKEVFCANVNQKKGGTAYSYHTNRLKIKTSTRDKKVTI